MHDEVVIYHNPGCSKSRRTLQLLRDRGIEPRIVEYLQAPPSSDLLRELLARLGLTPRQLMRTREAVYTEQQLAAETLDDEQLIAAMHSQPILIERPIVVTAKGAAIGRPPENVLDIL